MQPSLKYLIIFALVFLSGCAGTPLYVTDDGVSIYLQSKPEVEKDRYRIRFKFESPTDDSHVIQQIELGRHNGIESFRILPHGLTGVDTHHYDFDGTGGVQFRRMTIMPGVVKDVDESAFGFAMLPSDWPPNFNQKFLENHEIQGEIVKMSPEHATVYRLEFDRGRLVWYIEGEPVRREWVAEDK